MSHSFATPWTVAHQAPLSMGFLRQECWCELPFPPPGDHLTHRFNPSCLNCRWILYCWATRKAPQWWLFSIPVVANSLWAHGLQRTKHLSPSPSPEACPSSCPLHQWCSSTSVCVSHSVVSDFAIPWTVAHQAPLSMEFSRQEYWSGLPFPAPGDLPDSGIEPGSPALQTDSLPSELKGSPWSLVIVRTPTINYSIIVITVALVCWAPPCTDSVLSHLIPFETQWISYVLSIMLHLHLPIMS